VKAVRVIAIIVIVGGAGLGLLGVWAVITIRNYPVTSLFIPLVDVLIGVLLLIISNSQLKKQKLKSGELTERTPN
jgi:hypothetical protein